MPLVYVARHGETTWNVEGRYQGRLESDLSPRGIRQADALADALAKHPPLSAIVSSPLRRCTETARPTAERTGLAIETNALLIEIAHGAWEGRYRDEISRNDRERYRRWRSDPASVGFEGGETLRDVQRRWREFAAAFAPPGDALVVTHDAVVRSAIVTQTGRGLDALWSVRVENGAFATFAVENGAWQLLDECVDHHLAGMRADTGAQAL